VGREETGQIARGRPGFGVWVGVGSDYDEDDLVNRELVKYDALLTLVYYPYVVTVMFLENIKFYIFIRKKRNKNEDNLVININLNHKYINNVK
jgi:hypothetical protein